MACKIIQLNVIEVKITMFKSLSKEFTFLFNLEIQVHWYG